MDLQCSQISAPSAHCSRRAATPKTAPASSAEPMRSDNDWIGLLSFLFPFHHRDTGEDPLRSRVARHLRAAAILRQAQTAHLIWIKSCTDRLCSIAFYEEVRKHM